MPMDVFFIELFGRTVGWYYLLLFLFYTAIVLHTNYLLFHYDFSTHHPLCCFTGAIGRFIFRRGVGKKLQPLQIMLHPGMGREAPSPNQSHPYHETHHHAHTFSNIAGGTFTFHILWYVLILFSGMYEI